MHEPAQTVEVLPHVLGVDQELVDDAREARQREVERDRGIGRDHALDGGMRNIAFVPERDVLHGGQRHAAHEAREPREILGQNGVAFVRHGRRTLLPFGEELLHFEHFGALQVSDLDGEPLDRRRHDPEGGEEHGVPVARDHLGRHRLDREPHGVRHMRLDPRVDIGEGADCAR